MIKVSRGTLCLKFFSINLFILTHINIPGYIIKVNTHIISSVVSSINYVGSRVVKLVKTSLLQFLDEVIVETLLSNNNQYQWDDTLSGVTNKEDRLSVKHVNRRSVVVPLLDSRSLQSLPKDSECR